MNRKAKGLTGPGNRMTTTRSSKRRRVSFSSVGNSSGIAMLFLATMIVLSGCFVPRNSVLHALIPVEFSTMQQRRTTTSSSNNNTAMSTVERPSSQSSTLQMLEFNVHSENTTTSTTSIGNDSNSHYKTAGEDGYFLLPLQFVRSRQHQHKFNARRRNDSENNILTRLFSPKDLYRPQTSKWAFLVMPDHYQEYKGSQWAYLHVWKSGGSTVQEQLGVPHSRRRDPEVQARKWFTFVRDPIDHFLSGYSQCHCHDWYKTTRHLQWNESAYEGRIRDYLELTKASRRGNGDKSGCSAHSHPQANFLLNTGNRQASSSEPAKISPNLEIVGDMQEMVGILETILANKNGNGTLSSTASANEDSNGGSTGSVGSTSGGGGFRFDATIGKSNTAAENQCKREQFPARRDLLSDDTIRAICDFVAIDYYMFDFEPPGVCRQGLMDRGIIDP